MAEKPVQEPATPDVLLELNFVPKWAREPPAANPYVSVEEVRERRGRARRAERARAPAARRAAPPAVAEHPRAEMWPVEVSFVPDRQRLGAVVREIQRSRRAYPVSKVAALFLAKPEDYWVKIEWLGRADSAEEGAGLWQCARCQAVFLSRLEAVAHALAVHGDEFYEKETVPAEPPSGHFVCVGRCRLSGELVGPPNYHGFNEKIQELHRTRFAYMPLESYRRQIEILRDPELIERWKEACRVQVRYRPRGAPDAPAMTWSEVEADFARRHAPQLVRRVARAMIPAKVAREMHPGPLRRLVAAAWQREQRQPRTLTLALRPAFRHMGLYLFRTSSGTTFVTRIAPRAIDPEHAVASIREVLTYLREHPGCTRRQLAEGLRPGLPPESREVLAVLQPLRWLIERGHVVEFFDGTLALPEAGRGKAVGRAAGASPPPAPRPGN